VLAEGEAIRARLKEMIPPLGVARHQPDDAAAFLALCACLGALAGVAGCGRSMETFKPIRGCRVPANWKSHSIIKDLISAPSEQAGVSVRFFQCEAGLIWPALRRSAA
jgi:hypothetical protein